MAKGRPAAGTLDRDAVVVSDPEAATRLHGKTGAGAPQPGNTLRLTLVEAAYVTGMDRLAVDHEGTTLTPADILRIGARAGDQTEVEYLAYQDLRERGLLVRPVGDGTYQVWARGASQNDLPWLTVRILPERAPVDAVKLLAWAEEEVVLAVVDEDGCITYYECGEEHPEGEVPMGDLPPAPAVRLQDRVLVVDPDAVAAIRAESIGTPHGDGLVLSLTEAEALRQRGALETGDLRDHGASRQDHFLQTLATYQQLRRAGVVARSGFRFGTHLRAYQGGLDQAHARWLIQCHGPDELLPWPDLSRAVRLAHGVRKRFLVACVRGEQVRFASLLWFRP